MSFTTFLYEDNGSLQRNKATSLLRRFSFFGQSQLKLPYLRKVYVKREIRQSKSRNIGGRLTGCLVLVT